MVAAAAAAAAAQLNSFTVNVKQSTNIAKKCNEIGVKARSTSPRVPFPRMADQNRKTNMDSAQAHVRKALEIRLTVENMYNLNIQTLKFV